MSALAIRMEGVGKRYQIGGLRPKYATLRDSLANAVTAPFRRFKGRDARTEDLWAVRDVTYDIQQGDVVGIIGRNGAGKSTLLKVLARITEPTEGAVDIHGRVASLLEVGTGFHPELSGRENVYLNGAILGMKRAEIDRRFDEIVAFAEVEKFVETPVKNYSSGMYLRLAFAVAAHLEPEILIVDEVLAVGDIAFQSKCLGKMQDVAGTGRTVLFVSHNLAAVAQLCTTALVMENGRAQPFGVADAITHYERTSGGTSSSGRPASIKSDDVVEIVSCDVLNQDEQPSPRPGPYERIFFDLAVDAKQSIATPAFGIEIRTLQGQIVSCVNTFELGKAMPALSEGRTTVRVAINSIALVPGRYMASLWVMSHARVHSRIESVVVEIRQTPVYGTRELDARWGCMLIDVDFASR